LHLSSRPSLTPTLTRLLGFALLFTSLFCAACSTPAKEQQTAPTTATYFARDTTEAVQDGGVKVIPITTPKGTFNVWTKRFGNNPKMKLLLLNGGPGATHEYFECMENFLPAEGIEIIYYDQLSAAATPTTPRTPPCGVCRATWRKWSRCARR